MVCIHIWLDQWYSTWVTDYFFCFASFLIVCSPVNKQCASVTSWVTGLKRGVRAVVHTVGVLPAMSLPLTCLGIPESTCRTGSDHHLPRNSIIGLPVHSQRKVGIHVCSGQAEIPGNCNEPSRLLWVPQVFLLCPKLKRGTKSLPGWSW